MTKRKIEFRLSTKSNIILITTKFNHLQTIFVSIQLPISFVSSHRNTIELLSSTEEKQKYDTFSYIDIRKQRFVIRVVFIIDDEAKAGRYFSIKKNLSAFSISFVVW